MKSQEISRFEIIVGKINVEKYRLPKRERKREDYSVFVCVRERERETEREKRQRKIKIKNVTVWFSKMED